MSKKQKFDEVKDYESTEVDEKNVETGKREPKFSFSVEEINVIRNGITILNNMIDISPANNVDAEYIKYHIKQVKNRFDYIENKELYKSVQDKIRQGLIPKEKLEDLLR